MPAAVFALEPGAGLADEAVALGPALIVSAAIAVIVIGVGIAAERGGRNGARGAERAADHASRDVTGPEPGIVTIPAVVVPTVIPAVVPAIVPVRLVPVRLIVPSALIAAIGHAVAVSAGGAGVRIARPFVQTIGIRKFGLAFARVRDHLLRHRRARQHRG